MSPSRRVGARLVTLLLLLSAGGAPSGLSAQTVPETPTAVQDSDAALADADTEAAATDGYLQGRASIGPLQPGPVRVGEPVPTPSPAACTSRGLVLSAADTGAEVARIAFEADCTYWLALAPGPYRVELDRRGIDTSKTLPQIVTIAAGQTTTLDVQIDTGIR